MKIATKAALFSAVVFPGAGYFVVKRRGRGVVVLTISIVGLAMLMVEAYIKAQIIAEKIVRGVIPVDIQVIRDQLVLAKGVLSPETAMGISLTIGAVWIFSIVDGYRIGRAP
ncbi:hypothetical protein [Alkalimarinus alittae]|uniref:Uncharacterized protein n=1 Tax=Alkalimarinus alittae TaxID=2961619 RepID=A0ABY6N058_9ALTE|nr:hypothetical protein [Alkalimarinus alittae]UZE95480.1 hypothetical protein NKI27_15600 [Alkalimarinus alittae]